MELSAKKIEIIRTYFKNMPVIRAYLFGSYVRKQADKESDIDILVELDYSERIGLKFIQMKNELEELLKNKVDLVSENGLSSYIKPLIDKDKKLIYER